MDEALLDAFRATHYLVCLDQTEWADIRVDRTLPASLQALVGQRAWGFITAWNPFGEVRPESENLVAQCQLHSALKQLPHAIIFPAIGVGSDRHEPSLFVIGADSHALEILAMRHQQLAYVHGESGTPAMLRILC